MNTSKNLIAKINELITNIETNYPEIYHFIEEQPITVPSSDHFETNEKALQDYLNSLSELLQHHKETHKN